MKRPAGEVVLSAGVRIDALAHWALRGCLEGRALPQGLIRPARRNVRMVALTCKRRFTL
jgi:hypothetical protein